MTLHFSKMSIQEQVFKDVETILEHEGNLETLNEIQKRLVKLNFLFEEIVKIKDEETVMMSREIVELHEDMNKLIQEGKVKFNWGITVPEYPPQHMYWKCKKIVQLDDLNKSLSKNH